MIRDFETAFRAKINMMAIETHEEDRLMRELSPVVAKYEFIPVQWSITRGIETMDGRKFIRLDESSMSADTDPGFLFSPALLDYKQDDMPTCLCVFVKDIAPHMDNPLLQRLIRDELQAGKERVNGLKHFCFIDSQPWPVDIKGVMKIDMPLPDRDEIGEILDTAVMATRPDGLSDKQAAAREKSFKQPDARDPIVSALTGLTASEVGDALMMCAAENKGQFVPKVLMQQKKHLITTEALRYEEPDPRGLDGIGGLEHLKEYLARVKPSFSENAREWGLPRPKGIFLAGTPGCGKSLTAKCTATVFDRPLIRLDVGAIFGSLVGQSEANMRTVKRTLSAIAPVVLFIDEIEKGFGGVTGNERDGGTSYRVFGDFLQFLNDNDSGVYVVATSNKPTILPPELMRAGRFDAMYWLDLPNTDERAAIVDVLKKKLPHCSTVNASVVAGFTAGYSGSEIESAMNEGLRIAFSDGLRDVTDTDIELGLKDVMRVSESFKKQLEEITAWGKLHAKPASKPESAASITAASAAKEQPKTNRFTVIDATSAAQGTVN